MVQHGAYHGGHYQGTSFFLSDMLVWLLPSPPWFRYGLAQHKVPPTSKKQQKDSVYIPFRPNYFRYFFSFLQLRVDSLFRRSVLSVVNVVRFEPFLELLLPFQASLISRTEMKIYGILFRVSFAHQMRSSSCISLKIYERNNYFAARSHLVCFYFLLSFFFRPGQTSHCLSSYCSRGLSSWFALLLMYSYSHSVKRKT